MKKISVSDRMEIGQAIQFDLEGAAAEKFSSGEIISRNNALTLSLK